MEGTFGLPNPQEGPKDGIDQTHAGLLRMLGLAWGGEEKGARCPRWPPAPVGSAL